MANDDHIAQLMKGTAAWNAWREENPDIRPNLLGNLMLMDLSGVNLSKANLMASNLTGANLSKGCPTTACSGRRWAPPLMLSVTLGNRGALSEKNVSSRRSLN